jgi:hypothetical protein
MGMCGPSCAGALLALLTHKGYADVCKQKVHAPRQPQLPGPRVGTLHQLWQDGEGGSGGKRGGASEPVHTCG